jgi:hypothetical protein
MRSTSVATPPASRLKRDGGLKFFSVPVLNTTTYQGVVMNLSLRRVTDIDLRPDLAKAAWGIVAMLLIALMVGMAAYVMHSPASSGTAVAAANVQPLQDLNPARV